MSSDVMARPDLADHFLVTCPAAARVDCQVWAKFMVFKPDPVSPTYIALAHVRVVIKNKANVEVASGTTDSAGILWAPSSTSTKVRPVIPASQPGETDFHFEVGGPAGSTDSLKQKDWYGGNKFPIDLWSTRGWVEPEGQRGNFKPNSAVFGRPLTGGAYEEFTFRIGVAYRFNPYYWEPSLKERRFPSGLKFVVVVSDSEDNEISESEHITSFGKYISGVQFVTLGYKIVFFLDLSLEENLLNLQEHINVVVNSIETATADISNRFVNFSNLSGNPTNTSGSWCTEMMMDKVSIKPFSTISQEHFSGNDFINKSKDEKCAIISNYFVGYCVRYIRFMTFFKNITSQITTGMGSGSTATSWFGLPSLSIRFYKDNIGSNHGDAYSTPVAVDALGRWTSRITIGPKTLGRGQSSVVYHELTHALVNYYFRENGDSATGGDHEISLVTNSRVAYSEGLAEFFPMFFMDVSDAMEAPTIWNSNWRTMFSGTRENRPWSIVKYDEEQKKNIDIETGESPLGRDIGFKIEGAFALALFALWTDLIRGAQAGEKVYVDSIDDGGTLTSAENAWVSATILAKNAAKYLWGPLKKASINSSLGEDTLSIIFEIYSILDNSSKANSFKNTLLTQSLEFPFNLISIDGFALDSHKDSNNKDVFGSYDIRDNHKYTIHKNQSRTIKLITKYFVYDSSSISATTDGSANTNTINISRVTNPNEEYLTQTFDLVINGNTIGTYDIKITSSVAYPNGTPINRNRIIKNAIEVVP